MNDWQFIDNADNRRFYYRTADPEWYVTCDMCGQHFRFTRPNRRYCSAACKQKAYRQRRAAGLRPVMHVIGFITTDGRKERVNPMRCAFCGSDMYHEPAAHAHVCDECGAVFTRRHGWMRD